MFRLSSLLGEIFLLLLSVGPQGSAAITDPDLCAYHTPNGYRIRLELKPSLNSTSNFHKTVNLMNVSCCSHPDRKCTTPPRPLALSLDNLVSTLENHIRPKSMAVHYKSMWDFDFLDGVWYSLYEIKKPSLSQSLDVHLTFGQPDAMTESVFIPLDLNRRFKSIEDAETVVGLHLQSHPPFNGDMEDLCKTKKFLLIPEVADGCKKISQRTDANHHQDLVFERQILTKGFHDNLDHFDEMFACPLGVTDQLEQRWMNATCLYCSSSPGGLFSENQCGRVQNRSTTCSLNSYGTLNDPRAISRDRQAVTFASKHSVLLTIAISNDGNWYDSVKDHPYYVIGAFDLWMSAVKYLWYTETSLEDLWLSLVSDIEYAVHELSVVFRRFSSFDRIPYERSMNNRWNMIWSSTSTEAVENDILNGDLYHIEITILLLSAIVDITIGTMIILSLTICLRPRTSKASTYPSRRVACKDDVDSISSVDEDYDTVSTSSTNIAVTESFHSPPLKTRDQSSSMFVVDRRGRLNVFLRESASWRSFSRRPVNDQTSYDSDYRLDRCLTARDVTIIKYLKRTQRSIIMLSNITSLLRDNDVSSSTVSDESNISTTSTYQSDSYEESTFSFNMLSPSSTSSSTSLTSLTSSSSDISYRSYFPSITSHDFHDLFDDFMSVDNHPTNSDRGMYSSLVSSPSNHDFPIMDEDLDSPDISETSDIIAARVASGDAPNFVIAEPHIENEPTSIVSLQSLRDFASAVAVRVANSIRTHLPLFPDDDLFTEITDQITGTGYLSNGLLYPNLEEAFIFLSLASIRHRIAN